MPLPAPQSSWPPVELVRPHDDVTAWSAWWGGDPDVLSEVYGGTLNSTRQNGFEQSWARRGGLVGALQRWFWGQPTRPGAQRSKLHVPLAAEIPQVSADLLYGAPPAITVDDKATQEAVGRLLGERAHTVLYEGAEASAALGHIYYRVAVDREVDPDGPILSAVDADCAFPTYRYGRLVDCTFLSEYVDENGAYWRHFEHHTRGFIEHALYQGDFGNVGRVMPLDSHWATADLLPFLVLREDGLAGGIATGVDRLAVIGIPNAKTRTWRRLPAAKDLGRADIQGVEPVLDALDDTWTSWMRDIRHGRSRLHVPSIYLKSLGAGKGADFDQDQDIYVGMNSPLTTEKGMEITATQFAIRWAEHSNTADALLERAVSGAGYSPQTFGVDEQGSALTATESWARQTRTQNTRNSKIRYNRIGLIDLTALLVDMDRVHFGGKGNPKAIPEVHFQETVSESQQARAQTAQLLSAARAASIETLVQMQHPDWDETRVREEVERIKDEDVVTVPDPVGAFGDLEETPADEPADDPPADDEDPAA